MANPALFTPLALRGVTFRNRIVVSPMCQYAAIDGHIQPWHLWHHGRFALGGVGGAIVEATGVSREGRISHGCTGLYEDSHIAGMRDVVDIYHAQKIAVGVQIGHAGRKASSARPWDGAGPLTADSEEELWETMAPSALPAREGWPLPRVISEIDIIKVVDDFARAAGRACKAGFDFVEIHGAHGYLIHTFLSPLSNKRGDSYGGSLENRMRLPLMIAKAVRAVWPDGRPLFYRASVVDENADGLSLEDSVTLSRALKAIGVDVIDCSSGGVLAPIAMGLNKPSPGFQIPYAERIRREAGIATMAVGLITEPHQAEEAVAEGKADLVALGRELLADSNWAYRAARELGLANPYAALPAPYAFYLERRAKLLGR